MSTQSVDDENVEPVGEQEDVSNKRVFRKYSYRGVPLEKLMKMSFGNIAKLFPSRLRRKVSRGLPKEEVCLIEACESAKRACVGSLDKPGIVNTYARSAIIWPSMVGNVIGVHMGKGYFPVEIKPEMVGYLLSDFSATRVTPKHGRPGIGASSSSKFVPLK